MPSPDGSGSFLLFSLKSKNYSVQLEKASKKSANNSPFTIHNSQLSFIFAATTNTQHESRYF